MEKLDECRHCGVSLPNSHKGPCPQCGKTGKNVNASIHLSFTAGLSVKAQKVRESVKRNYLRTILLIILTVVTTVGGSIIGGPVGLILGLAIGLGSIFITTAKHIREIEN